MYRLLTCLACFFLLAAVAGFGAAAYLFFLPEDAPGATIDEPDREFPRAALGMNEVKFRLHNPTRHPVRVVGFQFC